MPVIGNPRTFHHKYRFVVEIDGVAEAAFQKMGELSAETAEVTYFEGGSLIPVKAAGRVTFADLTLERGAVTEDSDLYDWFREVTDAAANAGLNDPDYKRTLDVVQLDRTGAEVRRYTVYNCWVKTYVAGEWDNESDEVNMEKVTLAFDYFEKTAG